MKIDFNPKLFNPNFWHLKEHMADKNIRFIWLYGGSSSSKTYSGVQAILYSTLMEGSDTLVFRKTSNSIEKSIYKDFITIIGHWKMTDYFRCTKNPFRVKCISNGAVIDFAGMDDPEKIKGISQYKRIYNNEISAFDKMDYDQIRKRLRGLPGQQIMSDFNPIDELHWIKEKVFDVEEQYQMPTKLSNGIVDPVYTEITEKWINGSSWVTNPRSGKKKLLPPNMVVLRSNYKNNFWAIKSPCGTFGYYDVQLLADFEKDKRDDINFYNVYALGLWGKYNVGGEFYKKFNRDTNVIENPGWKRGLPLHISFDENVNPYLSLSVYQAEGRYAWKIDEICLKSPRNNLAHTLAEFIKRYPPNKSGLYVYGDRTSLKEDTKLEKGQNFFTIITHTLHRYSPSLRLPTANPPVAMRGNFINDIILLKGMYKVSDNCRNTIIDYEYLKEAEDGTKAKLKTKDPTTHVSYQKYGHMSDTDDYFLCQFFAKEFREYQSGKGQRAVFGYKNRTRSFHSKKY